MGELGTKRALEAFQGHRKAPARASANPSVVGAVPRPPLDGQPTKQSGRPGRGFWLLE